MYRLCGFPPPAARRSVWFCLFYILILLSAHSPSSQATSHRLQPTIPPGGPTPAAPSLASVKQTFLPIIETLRTAKSKPMQTSSAQPGNPVTATPVPSPTEELPIDTTQEGSAGIPPTPTPTSPADSAAEQCRAELVNATERDQLATIEANLACVTPFVDLLLTNPTDHLTTYYALITSTATTDALWSVNYERARLGRFRFQTHAVMEDLWLNLPKAVANCQGASRCSDWETYILPYLTYGELYQCPELARLTAAEMVASVPFGDYYCTEETAAHLAEVVDEQVVGELIGMGSALNHDWARRNVIRVLGRLAEQPPGTFPHLLLTQLLREPTVELLLDRLGSERSPAVLHDVIWVLDSHFFPLAESQDLLQDLSASDIFDSDLRFRAMAAIGRLVAQKQRLDAADQQFLEESLSSDDVWVRAQAAFTLQLVKDVLSSAEQRAAVIGVLQAAYAAEEEFIARVSLAQALDSYNGTELRAALQRAYEDDHLGQQLAFNHIAIRSGLSEEDLPAFMTRMRYTEAAFFEKLGPPFDTPVAGDPTTALHLYLFATRDEYREYMNAFVGYGAEAGGLYLEGLATLYTYQRKPGESTYSVEHLIQHEFTHYLQGRYVFPGIWTEAGYHLEPKGWLDEGTAEFFGFAEFTGTGAATYPQPAARLINICGGSRTRSLAELLALRAGYDQAGTFDYDYAWAFVYFLMLAEEEAARQIYRAFRNNSYHLADFAQIAERSVASLELQWHRAMDQWCADTEAPVTAAGTNRLAATFEVITLRHSPPDAQPPRDNLRRQSEQIIRLIHR